jgi:anionic cell wall polymer biosynthesis LytR-Cps2A-Psr (LCP) family protein
VEIDINRLMKYKDRAGNLNIDIELGLQVLDGNKAEKFIRFRDYPRQNLDRIEAQQQFIKALIKALLKPYTLLKLPEIIKVVQNNVETDISPLEMISLGNLARKLSSYDIKMHILPGEGKYISEISYFIHDQGETDDLIDEIFVNKVNDN